METDIGNPIEYNSNVDLMRDNKPQHHEEEEFFYEQPPLQHQQQMMYMQPPQPHMSMDVNNQKIDLFSSMDKNVVVIAFAVFLLGFFMGKTMQPVILRYT
jgi:hypothetical protein